MTSEPLSSSPRDKPSRLYLAATTRFWERRVRRKLLWGLRHLLPFLLYTCPSRGFRVILDPAGPFGCVRGREYRGYLLRSTRGKETINGHLHHLVFEDRVKSVLFLGQMG